ncbi:DUF4190 domain-containing protein [Kitasatospora sp. NPDC059722]|uniref:DUF4190 domain-containing protein n=1 Tax=Kitasatospora sp. NPDC059722 TaxID=3346925 RepID=UPI0036C8AEB2
MPIADNQPDDGRPDQAGGAAAVGVPSGGWSGYAITSLVAGVLGVACFLWVAGLAFGIAALRGIPRRNQRGRGLAVAGIVLSALWALSFAVAAALGAFGHPLVPVRSARAEPSGTVSEFGLRRGDCFETPDAATSKDRTRVRPVSCAERHSGEVFAVATADDPSYPGPYPLQRETTKACEAQRNAYAMDTWALPRSVRVHDYLPDEQSWESSGHRIVCWFADDEGERTGSLRRDETALTTEQIGYLQAADRMEGELAGAPRSMDLDGDPTSARPWADRLSAAVNAEVATLDSTAWSDRVRQPAADLKAELLQMLPALAALRTASDGTSAQEDVAAVRSHGGHTQAAAVRTALGLASE